MVSYNRSKDFHFSKTLFIVSELSVDTQKTKERLTTTITVASDHDSDSEESGKFAVAEEGL